MTISLLYHDLVDPSQADTAGFPGPLAARYKITPVEFERHLNAIAALGRSVGLATVDHRPAVSFSFDDGGASALVAAEALERHGWRGHFFITTERIGHSGFLTRDGVRELDRRGHEVGTHSHSHPTLMAKLPDRQIEDEWRTSRMVLSEILGREPTTASVPGGYSSSIVVRLAARAGYQVLMTSDPRARVRHVEGMAVFGRYAIRSTTSTRTVRAYAAGRPLARARQAIEWEAKRVAKSASPKAYQQLRRLRASIGSRRRHF